MNSQNSKNGLLMNIAKLQSIFLNQEKVSQRADVIKDE